MHTKGNKTLATSLLPILSVVALFVGAVLVWLFNLPDSTTTIATVANAAGSELDYVSESEFLGIRLGETRSEVERPDLITDTFVPIEIKLGKDKETVREAHVRVNMRNDKVHSVDVTLDSREWSWDDMLCFIAGFFPPNDWTEDRSRSTWGSEEGRISNQGFSVLRLFNSASGKELLILSHQHVTVEGSPSYQVTWSMAR